MLLQGYRLNGKREYLDAAQSQLDYIMGRNPLGVSFVTGQGLRSPMHIHHRPSPGRWHRSAVPGLMAGGPNPGQQDLKDCPANVKYASSLPALSWLDNECSYASNEIAINWNAPRLRGLRVAGIEGKAMISIDRRMFIASLGGRRGRGGNVAWMPGPTRWSTTSLPASVPYPLAQRPRLLQLLPPRSQNLKRRFPRAITAAVWATAWSTRMAAM